MPGRGWALRTEVPAVLPGRHLHLGPSLSFSQQQAPWADVLGAPSPEDVSAVLSESLERQVCTLPAWGWHTAQH